MSESNQLPARATVVDPELPTRYVERVFRGLREAKVLDERTLQQLHAFVYEIGDWRYARRRKLERHVVKDRAPMLDLQTGISRSVASRKARRGTTEKCPTVLL